MSARNTLSLRSTLLITVGLLMLLGYAVTGLLISSRYSKSLESALEAHSTTMAQSLGVQLADIVLINDITAVQKLLDSLVRSHKLSYAYIARSSKVLAHTFENGMPQELLAFNPLTQQDAPVVCMTKKFRFAGSTEILLDVACPIYEGKAGIIHLGVSENAIQKQVMELLGETALATLAVLAIALVGVFFLLQRLARPLETLVGLIQQVGGGGKNTELTSTLNEISGQREITTLAQAFHEMLERLDEQSKKVTRSYRQLVTCNTIISGVVARKSLQAMGEFLLTQCRTLLRCADITLLFFDLRYNSVLSISTDKVRHITGHEHLQNAVRAAVNTEQERAEVFLEPPLVPERFSAYDGQMQIPILYESKICGLFISGCVPGCRCDRSEIALVSLVLGQISGAIYRALEYEDEVKQLQEQFAVKETFCGLVGRDSKMQQLFKRIEDISPSDASILIQSESGTGKELVARAVHALSPRKERPFIVINCGAYPDTLLESELFGHEKGAFTGADKQRIGRFEQAQGGTVFLDEIGDITPAAQVKLLRVLQARVIERLGGNKEIPVNVRIIAATNQNLQNSIAKGAFREDLYYRLDVISLWLPPLRERVGDIALLVQYFLDRFSLEHNKSLIITPAAMQLLTQYNWPGNVRELENCLAQAAILSNGGVITPAELPARIMKNSPAVNLEQNEKNTIIRVLDAVQGNKKLAAAQLEISRTTLYSKMKKFGLT